MGGVVKMRYNYPKPTRLKALANRQGTDIDGELGQERNLAHEARWTPTQTVVLAREAPKKY